MLFGEWVSTWLSLYVDTGDLAPSTVACYRRAANAIPEWLRGIPVASLTPIDVRRWLLEVAHDTPRAAQLDRVMLMRCLTIARKCGLTSIILDEDTCPPIVHRAARAAVLKPEEIRAYIAAAEQTNCAPLLLLCLCGLRRGEALGARWEDYDEATGVYHVTGQRVRVSGVYEYRPTKTKHGDRALLLPNGLQELLKHWPRISPWVCDTSPESLRFAHRRAMLAAGITTAVTLHGLRHTMATIAIMAGVPVKALQSALGHATYTLTADLYADHLPSTSTFLPGVYACAS